VLPVALMQGAVTWAFFDQHWQTTTARLSESVAGEVSLVVRLYERDRS
jgi:two-component system osmolarity sensor histidine kinase EnvZ